MKKQILAHLGPIWSLLGAPWPEVAPPRRAKLLQLGPKLGPTWRHVAPGTISKEFTKKYNKKKKRVRLKIGQGGGVRIMSNPQRTPDTRDTIWDTNTPLRRRRMEDIARQKQRHAQKQIQRHRHTQRHRQTQTEAEAEAERRRHRDTEAERQRERLT